MNDFSSLPLLYLATNFMAKCVASVNEVINTERKKFHPAKKADKSSQVPVINACVDGRNWKAIPANDRKSSRNLVALQFLLPLPTLNPR
jgi:hypothetical protein